MGFPETPASRAIELNQQVENFRLYGDCRGVGFVALHDNEMQPAPQPVADIESAGDQIKNFAA